MFYTLCNIVNIKKERRYRDTLNTDFDFSLNVQHRISQWHERCVCYVLNFHQLNQLDQLNKHTTDAN